MSGRVVALVLVIVVFGALSGLAVREVGYFGIVTPLLEHWGGRQVLVDRGRFVRAPVLPGGPRTASGCQPRPRRLIEARWFGPQMPVYHAQPFSMLPFAPPSWNSSVTTMRRTYFMLL